MKFPQKHGVLRQHIASLLLRRKNNAPDHLWSQQGQHATHWTENRAGTYKRLRSTIPDFVHNTTCINIVKTSRQASKTSQSAVPEHTILFGGFCGGLKDVLDHLWSQKGVTDKTLKTTEEALVEINYWFSNSRCMV